MFELEEKIIDLIKWVVDTYGISEKDAKSSIIHKLNDI